MDKYGIIERVSVAVGFLMGLRVKDPDNYESYYALEQDLEAVISAVKASPIVGFVKDGGNDAN